MDEHMRYLLSLLFIGTNYCGWQVQPNGVSIQQKLQDAAEAVLGHRPGITGCSRTDAGVHADMFCCCFDAEDSLTPEKWPGALNAHLPLDIAVFGCREVPEDFHPRYAATAKRYRYLIWNHPTRNPFYEGRALHWRNRLDEAVLNEAARAYLGKHDFSAFCAAGSTVEDKVRAVRLAEVTREGDLVTFTAEADGFLYNMVRIMAGTLLDPERRGNIPVILEGRDRNRAGATAPAHGLYLDHVYYKL